MEELATTYIPIDRRLAMARGEELSDQGTGSVLFADISGFTPLTAALLKELGLSRGPEELTRQLNLVYDALIAEVDRYGGSVIGFAGDAITCWLDGDDGSRAVACGLAMQQTMDQFKAITTPSGTVVSLAMKAAVAAGAVRRFVVGDPKVQLVDALAGSPLNRMAAAEHQAEKGEVVVAPELVTQLGDRLVITERRTDPETGLEFAVVTGLTQEVTPQPWPALTEELDERQVRAWILPPVYERLQSGQGQFLAEIRAAVALFVRFGGIDFDGDEQAGQKLDAYLKWVQRILTRYEGFLIQLTIGDKGCYLYAAFGAPITHENDPARAVATAVELQTAPPELAFIGQIQIGISRGRMRTGAYGGTTRRTYGVLGDETNMAARLMTRAEPGQIIISQQVADAVSQEYRLEYLGLIQVKGKIEPLPVSLVLGRRQQGARRPINLFPTPLVGREVELAQLEAYLAGSLSGAGQVVRLEGPAGVGKSHLVSEYAERALRGFWRVVSGSCQSTSQDISYHAWRQIFRTLFFLVDDDNQEDPQARDACHLAVVETALYDLNPAWLIRLPLLGDLLRLPIDDNETTAAFDPHLRREALLTLAIDLIQSWARTQPLLLLIEDAHWLDEASRELTIALARVITRTSTPVLLVLVHRPPLYENQPLLPELNDLPNSHHLELGDLSPEGVAALVANRLHSQPAPLLLNLIQIQARGNPFFVEELLETLREANNLAQRSDGSWTLSDTLMTSLRRANCLTQDSQGEIILNPDVSLVPADLGLPDSIHGLVLSRLDRLLEAHKLTIKVASVIGRVFQFQLLADSHPVAQEIETLLKQIKEIEEREFTRLEVPVPSLTHIFKHNITRDVAYETLLEAQQRQLHLAVAEAMESLLPDAIEQLAYHFSRAGVRDKTLHYLDLAAHKAQREYANETALNYYQQALALEERWEWLKGLIEVLHILGRREEERAALEQLQNVPTAPSFEVAYLWGRYYEVIADYPQAQAAVERALAASQAAGQRGNEAWSLAQLGLIARQPGDYEQAKAWFQQALALFPEGQAYSDEETRALIYALNGLGTTYRQQGEFDQAKASYERALSLSRQRHNLVGEAEALNSLGVTAYYQRQLDLALGYYQQALTFRRTIGDRSGEGKSLYSMSIVTLELGDYAQAQTHLSAALTILQATNNRWDEGNVWNYLGILYQELGELSQAQESLERALAIAQEIGDEAGQAYTLANLGLVARDREDLGGSQAWLNNGLTLAQAQDDKYLVSIVLNYLSTVNLRLGQLPAAIEQAEASLTLRQKLEMRFSTADNFAILANIYLAGGQRETALNYAEQALGILNECAGKGPEFPVLDYFICYQVFAADGETRLARLALQSAYQGVIDRAEKITDPALRQSFLEQVSLNREIVAAYQGNGTPVA
jgi:adenylate cyclase